MTTLFNLILLVNQHDILPESFCNKLLLNSVSGIIALIGIAIAAILAYKFALRQKKQEIFIGLERIKYERKLSAIEACWKLLAFTTDTENNNSVLIWKQDKGSKAKVFYMNVENARRFIKQLAACFYGTGLGIYLSQDIKKLLFEYRGILYGFLLATSNSEDKLIQIRKEQMHRRMAAIHVEMVEQLKKETEVINKQD